MPTKFENPKLSEDKIMNATKPKPLNDEVLFTVFNQETNTNSTYEWRQLRHMFDAKIENLILKNYPKEVVFKNYKITLG
ncbi:MAG: hypothetical protein BWY78_00675 [Alphaproteobacteria bacterium ADurb.Bin438]|nr:MAG: hypothetical protein BWY78_00675 [Alphaproteobacteria bacterium ADurb.Bin438]